MNLREQFEKETNTPEDYDPDGNREDGFFSIAYNDKYIKWLEKIVTTPPNSRYAAALNVIKEYCEGEKPVGVGLKSLKKFCEERLTKDGSHS